ncbi:MAG: HTTM domain-containing protein [Burkholderiales bacterium]|nr:HTTM domain-containing protein [Anaerolineae bacterium]
MSRFVPPTSAFTLGVFRALVCAVLLANALWEDLSNVTKLPLGLRQRMGTANWLPEAIFTNETLLIVIQLVTIITLVLGMLGLWTRLTLPTALVSTLLMGGIIRSMTSYYHINVATWWLLLILCWTPCADTFSIDAWRKRDTYAALRKRTPPMVYGWARYACWVLLVLVYLAAGLNKLRQGGLLWWDATNLRSIVYRSALEPSDFDFAAGLVLENAPDALFALLGITSLVIELGYASVLFSRRARWVFPALAAAMHIGIFLLQKIFFYDLVLLQLLFVDWERVYRWLQSKFNRADAAPETSAPASSLRQ